MQFPIWATVSFLFVQQLVQLSAALEYAPIVTVKSGQLRGIVEEVDQKKVYSYQGVRYGRASRFALPEAVHPWTGIYNATGKRFACPQPGYALATEGKFDPESSTIYGSEDCLYLNIWRPVGEVTSNRSVMVWIHGGGYMGGSIFQSIYNGKYIAASGDVVIVSLQYRLGVFGFLYGGTPEAPGNQGLQDLIFGLKWVQENIHHFTGDPSKVTIFGESAGSFAVGSLVLSPLASGLFHRAIMQSGAPNSYLGSISRAKGLESTHSLAERFNCSGAAQKLVQCFRSKTTQEILDKAGVAHTLFDGESFLPVYGDHDPLLPLNPVEALKTGQFNPKVDLLFGVNSGEGGGFIVDYFKAYLDEKNGGALSVKVAHSLIGFLFQLFRESYSEEVADFYTKGLNDSDKDALRRAVGNSFGDYHLVCPEILFAEQYARLAPQNRFYSYRLVHQTASGCKGWKDVCHGEDIQYIFGQPIIDESQNSTTKSRYSPVDRQLAIDMSHAWTQFAKTGVPGPMGGVQWAEAFDQTNFSTQFMALDPTNYQIVPGYYKPVCNTFWKAKIFQ